MYHLVQKNEVLIEDKVFHNGDVSKTLRKGTNVVAHYSFDLECSEEERYLVSDIVLGAVLQYGELCRNLKFLFDEVDRAYSINKEVENLQCDINLTDFEVYYSHKDLTSYREKIEIIKYSHDCEC